MIYILKMIRIDFKRVKMLTFSKGINCSIYIGFRNKYYI